MSTMMPPNEPASPTYGTDNAAIWKEIQAIWRLVRGGKTPIRPSEVVFSYAGAPQVGVQSPPYQVRESCLLNRVTLSLGTIGSTQSVATVYTNGDTLGTVTADANEKTGFELLNFNVSDGDMLTAAITTLGAGATNVTVQVSW